MKRLTVVLIVAAMLLVTTPAYAQTVSGAHGRPWWRLFIFIPVSVLVGAGVAVGRRIARDRGWFGR